MEGLLSTEPTLSSFLTVTSNCQSKVNPIGALHTEKIAEAVLLNVFKMAFPVSLFKLKIITNIHDMVTFGKDVKNKLGFPQPVLKG